MEFEQTKRILAAMDRHKADHVLVSGMAMAAQGSVRAIRDIDIVVSAEVDNVDRLKTALRELLDDPEIDSIRADELAGDYPAIHCIPPSGQFLDPHSGAPWRGVPVCGPRGRGVRD